MTAAEEGPASLSHFRSCRRVINHLAIRVILFFLMMMMAGHQTSRESSHLVFLMMMMMAARRDSVSHAGVGACGCHKWTHVIFFLEPEKGVIFVKKKVCVQIHKKPVLGQLPNCHGGLPSAGAAAAAEALGPPY